MEISLIFLFIILLTIFILLFFKIDYLIYFFCITCPIVDWFYRIKISIFSGIDILAISFPCALLIKFIITKRSSVISEFNKDETIILYYFLLLSLLIGGIFPLYIGKSYSIKTFYDIITDWAKFSTYFIVLLVFSGYVLNKKSIEKLFLIFPFSLLLPGAYFFWQLITNQLVRNAGRLIPSCGFVNPHFITYDVMMILPMVIFNIYNAKIKSHKIMWTISFLIMLLIAFFSQARTGWFAIVAELFIVVLLLDSKKNKFLIFSFILLLLSSLYLLGYLDLYISKLSDISYFFHHINEVWNSQDKKIITLFSGRWGIWRADIKAFFHSTWWELLFGRGIGSAVGIAAAKTGFFVAEAHNSYIVLLIDFGIINFVLYCCIMVLMFIKAIRFLKSYDPFIKNVGKSWICLLGGYIVVNIGTHLCYTVVSSWIFWAFCGTCIGLYKKF